jgi:hypothetical protein
MQFFRYGCSPPPQRFDPNTHMIQTLPPQPAGTADIADFVLRIANMIVHVFLHGQRSRKLAAPPPVTKE